MQYADEDSGGYMSRAARMHNDAIIAFLLFCLEIYQAEQQRKRKLH
jgi:phosphomannomutase